MSDQDIDAANGLSTALRSFNGAAGSNDIQFNASPSPFILTNSTNGQNLFPIILASNAAALTINVNNSNPVSMTSASLSPASNTAQIRGFYIQAGDVTIHDFTFSGLVAHGGNGGDGGAGGGGGLGAGGALFIYDGATATLQSCTFSNNIALGGNGGTGDFSLRATVGGGGGGGMGGDGGSAAGILGLATGGGGGGFFGFGGAGAAIGGAGGGGLFGSGGTCNASSPSFGGGGGGGGTDAGATGNGGDGTAGAAGSGGTSGGGSGGTPGVANSPGAAGTPGGGGGGGAGDTNAVPIAGGNGGNGNNFGGGGSGGVGDLTTVLAGTGGFGGGGAGGRGGDDISNNGGSGTVFGGGGGGSGCSTSGLGSGFIAGSGSFGGGGGGSASGSPGSGGQFGGAGGAGGADTVIGGGGGGGAGLGGTVYLGIGSTLNLQSFNSLTGDFAFGAGGGGGGFAPATAERGQNGRGFGPIIFMRQNSSIHCSNSDDALSLGGIQNDGGGGTSITMSGTGTLTFTHTISIDTLNLNSGRTNANGFASVTNPVSVPTGAGPAIFGGNGTLAAIVTAGTGGTISPGPSIATLTVNSMTFNPGSSFNVEVSPSMASKLIATSSPGTAIINDGTLNIMPDSDVSNYSLGTVYTIIDGQTSRTGEFTTVTNTNPMIGFQVLYSPNLVQLLISSIAVSTRSSASTTGNAAAAATAFNTLNPSNPSVSAYIAFLSSASSAQLQCDFDAMQPALFNAIPITQQAATTAVRKTLTDRLQEIHGAHCPQSDCIDAGIRESACGMGFDDRKYSLWLTPLGNFTKQNSRSQHGTCDNSKVGFSGSTWGSTLGFDAIPFDYLAIGGAVSYVHTDLDWKGSLADSQTNSVYGSLFGSLFNSLVYLDLGIMGAYDHFDASRRITLTNLFSTLHLRAKHKEDAGEFDAFAEFGYTLNHTDLQFNPFVTMDYQHLHQGNYKESGAEAIDLEVQKRNSNLLRTEAGARFSLCQKSIFESGFSFIEQVKLSYVHEERFDGKKTTSEFIGPPDSSSFVVNGFWPDRDLISPGASFQIVLPNNQFSLDFRYDGEFGKNWYNHTGSLEILYAF